MDNETMNATTAQMPAVASQEAQQPAGMTYVSDIIGEAYKGWENGRVIFDCGTGRGKNEFIIRKLADYSAHSIWRCRHQTVLPDRGCWPCRLQG